MMAYITLILTGIVPILSCVLSALLSSKLTNYKIDQLQKSVSKLTDTISDIVVFKEVAKEQIKVSNHRISDIEEVLKNDKKT